MSQVTGLGALILTYTVAHSLGQAVNDFKERTGAAAEQVGVVTSPKERARDDPISMKSPRFVALQRHRNDISIARVIRGAARPLNNKNH